MSWKYLTRAYVEAQGYARIAIHKQPSSQARFLGDTPRLGTDQAVAEGVAHGGDLYEREPDGLAYVRLPAIHH